MAEFISSEDYAVGDHVEFNWNNFINPDASPFWFECVITANHGALGFDIEMFENRVLNDPIMLYTKDGSPLVVGSIVSYNWRFTGNWYDYVVTKVNEDRTVNLVLECTSVSPAFLRKLTAQDQYVINEIVEYEWGGGCNWFNAKVIAVHPNGTYDIALIDENVSIDHLSLSTRLGPTEPRPSFSMVKPGSLQEGQLVEYNWQGKGYWYFNYMVIKVLSDTTCDVQLVDKDIHYSALRRKNVQLASESSTLENEQTQSNGKPFVVGDVVQHNWNNGGTWWDGYSIMAIHDDDPTNLRYDVRLYDENMGESWGRNVSVDLIRHPNLHKNIATSSDPLPDESIVKPFVVGDVVQHNWNNGGSWWNNYTIIAIHNDDLTNLRYDLQYTDESVVHDVPPTLIRYPLSMLALELSTLDIEKTRLEEIIAVSNPLPDESIVKPFVVGDVVQHNWNNSGSWWDNYTIIAIHHDDPTNPRYDLKYTDESMVHDVPPTLIRHPESEVAKARRDLSIMNRKIKVKTSRMEFERRETIHGNTDVLTLDAIEALLLVVLEETKVMDGLIRDVDTIEWTGWTDYFDTSLDVLKLSERLVSGRKETLIPSTTSSSTVDDFPLKTVDDFPLKTVDNFPLKNEDKEGEEGKEWLHYTVIRALSLKQQIDAQYYGSKDANSTYYSLENAADSLICGGFNKFPEAMEALQEANRVWNNILDQCALDKNHKYYVIKTRNERQSALCQAVLDTKVNVSFPSGAVAEVYDPIAIEALTKLTQNLDSEIPFAVSQVSGDMATANTVAKECCYCHKPSTEGIAISHGDFLCIDCQHDSPLSVYYTNSR